MIQKARIILRYADNYKYERYFHVWPFLEVIFNSVRLPMFERQIFELTNQYNNKLERKRKQEGKEPLPDSARFSRSLLEVSHFILTTRMPE